MNLTMGRKSTQEETQKCIDLGAQMLRPIEGSEKRYVFGAISFIAEYLFDTYFDTEEEKRTAFHEWSEHIKVRLFGKDS